MKKMETGLQGIISWFWKQILDQLNRCGEDKREQHYHKDYWTMYDTWVDGLRCANG